ncbi:extracellular solute-binding protein [Streptomyces sp. NPDC060194]|uniref:extracellular solute-binding protein n=1 Tax=Streptomyces sp. NPDC060194 TaxID=3347069 RepID=UPI00365E0E1C
MRDAETDTGGGRGGAARTPSGAPTRSAPRGPTRRGLLRGAAALAATGAGALALGGCGDALARTVTGGQGPSGRIDFWNPFTGGDGQRMEEMIAAYRKTPGGHDVRSTTLTWGSPYYTKLSLAALGDSPPEVAVVHLSRLPSLARGGLVKPLETGRLKRHGLTAGRFDPRPWDKAHVDDRLYAVPLDTHPFVLYANTDVCEKAGLLEDGRLPALEGPDAFVEALRAVKEVTGAYGVSMASRADPGTSWRMFYTLYCQLGDGPQTVLLADGGTEVRLDEGRAEEAFAFLRRLSVEERLLPRGADGPGAIGLFTGGRAGLLLDGAWQLPAIEAAKIPFDMRPTPRFFTDGPFANYADSHALALPANAAHVDETLDFVAGMLDDAQTWATGGHVPAWLPVQQSDAYKELTPQSHYAAAADAALYDPDAWYSGAGSTLQNQLGGVVAGVIGGLTRPAAAVRSLRDKLTVLAATSAPV